MNAKNERAEKRHGPTTFYQQSQRIVPSGDNGLAKTSNQVYLTLSSPLIRSALGFSTSSPSVTSSSSVSVIPVLLATKAPTLVPTSNRPSLILSKTIPFPGILPSLTRPSLDLSTADPSTSFATILSLSTFTTILAPTKAPSPKITKYPIFKPTFKPWRFPTSEPSSRPSPRPTAYPTPKPTENPSSRPSAKPSSRPTSRPSSTPSSKPSTRPTPSPSKKPTPCPTRQPIRRPTARPTRNPSATRTPTFVPTAEFTEMPSLYPSLFHTPSPSASPSLMVTSSAVPSSAHITTTFSSTAFPTNLQLSRPSAAPQVLFPTISPTPSTFYTSVLPCLLPTLPPVSWAPTRLPSDSIAPPSQLPTVIASWIPTINSLEFLTFTASNTIAGLNATVFALSSSAQGVFKDTVAASMPPIPASSVTVSSIKQQSLTLTGSRKLRNVKFATSNSQNALITLISYTVSTSLQSIGQSNATLAFQHLSQLLSQHVSNGSFTQTLRRKAVITQNSLLTSVNVTSVSFSLQYTTYSPTESPLQSTATVNTDKSFASWPLYAKILLPVACLLFVVALVVIVVFLVYFKCGVAADTPSNKEVQKSFVFSDIYGRQSAAKPELPARSRYRRPTAAYDASTTPGEEKGNSHHQQSLTSVSVDNSQVIVTVPEYSSPMRQSPTTTPTSPTNAKSPPRTPPQKKSDFSSTFTSSPSLVAAAASDNIPGSTSSANNNNTTSPTNKLGSKKKSSSGGRSRTTATVNGSSQQLQSQRSKVLRVDSFRKSKGDFTSGDFL